MAGSGVDYVGGLVMELLRQHQFKGDGWRPKRAMGASGSSRSLAPLAFRSRHLRQIHISSDDKIGPLDLHIALVPWLTNANERPQELAFGRESLPAFCLFQVLVHPAECLLPHLRKVHVTHTRIEQAHKVRRLAVQTVHRTNAGLDFPYPVNRRSPVHVAGHK